MLNFNFNQLKTKQMKTIMKKWLLPALFTGTLAFAFYACSLDDVCEESTGACGTFTACCDGDGANCWYVYDGRTFDCNGADCSDAATELAEVMCEDNLKSYEEFNAVRQQLLDAVDCGCK
jgi:hypothetical protein